MTPFSPLHVELDNPQLKMDLAMAAVQLEVRLDELVSPLLAAIRGAPGQTDDLIRSWHRATKRKEK